MVANNKNINSHNLLSSSKFDNWLTSLNSLLEEIPALEVSTTIVAEITPEVFIPWEVYRAIYQISPAYLQSRGIDSELGDRFLDLRRRLELQYALLLVNPDSKLYNSKLKPEVQADLPILAEFSSSWENIPNRLPSPESVSAQDQKNLHKLLQEPQFLITLRQLGKLKDTLDRKASNIRKIAPKDALDNQIIADATYAKTSIKIDGEIANCYPQEILKLDLQQQRNIIELHNQGILAGEKQWHQLFKFILKTLTINH